MKNYLLVVGMFFVFGFSSVAQELNNYKYVRVPEKFDFQKEENKYRLNELMAFLLGKQDFEVLYKNPVPEGVSACDILEADVHNKSGLFKTKVYFTLTDCNNKTLFTSEVGDSRIKEFKESYQEALREAFQSLEELQHQYSEGPKTVVVQAIVPAEEKISEVGEENSAEVEGTAFVNGGKSYLLKQTASGFTLFKGNGETVFAKLVKSGRGDSYLYTSEKINGNAFFDAKGNLVVEYLVDGQLVNVLYSRVQ